MALTTVKSIETALSLIDSKKENLKKAFEDLQLHSSLLSSIPFTWPDLDTYFSSVHSDLLQKLSVLQSLESSRKGKPETVEKKESFFVKGEPVPARPELKSLCENMDGLGLRKYVLERPLERTAIRVELADAFKHAPDPGLMVLDALEDFCDRKLASGSNIRTGCVVLLEELMRSEVEIGPEARERAKSVAAGWKGKLPPAETGDGDEDAGLEKLCYLERLVYLLLLATFKPFDDVVSDGVDELIDCAVSISRYRQAVDLCRIIGLGNRISDVVQRLISKGKQLVALKYIFEFGLTDEFPPVPLLKAYVMDARKIAQRVRKNGKNSLRSLNDASVKEISALKSVIKRIEEHDLESQFPKDTLVKRIEQLEKEKADWKKLAAAPVPKPQQQIKQPKKNGNKRMKSTLGPSSSSRKLPGNVFGTPPQPSSVKRSGMLPAPAAPYVGSPAGAYGITGTRGAAVAAVPYTGSSADVYGLQATPMVGYSGNPNPAASNPYPPETHSQPVYYDRAIGYGGYEVPPQYHPVYYPQ